MPIEFNSKIPDKKNSHVFRLVERIVRNQYAGNTFFIGIAGAGGTGKTTFAKNLCDFIGPGLCATIDLDDYLFSRGYRAKLEITGYNPAANRLDLARYNLEDLKQGREITKPRYDHRTGKLLPEEKVEPRNIIIVEGVTTLYPELQELHNICDRFLFWHAVD
jgi:uridine kinase